MLPPISFFLVALRRAVLQVATWSLRNTLAEMRNRPVGISNGLVLFPAVDLIDTICKDM